MLTTDQSTLLMAMLKYIDDDSDSTKFKIIVHLRHLYESLLLGGYKFILNEKYESNTLEIIKDSVKIIIDISNEMAYACTTISMCPFANVIEKDRINDIADRSLRLPVCGISKLTLLVANQILYHRDDVRRLGELKSKSKGISNESDVTCEEFIIGMNLSELKPFEL